MSTSLRLLSEKPSDYDKAELLHQCLFSAVAHSPHLLPEKFNGYLAYYQRELEIARPHKYARALQHTWGPSVGRHADLLACLVQVRRDQNATREELVRRLKIQYAATDEDELQRLLELSMRVGFFLNVRQHDGGGMLDSLKSFPIQWSPDTPLKELIGRQFPRSKWRLNANESRLHPRFTAAFMVQVCSLVIDWTDSLADHLYLDRQSNTLYLFPHKSCLAALLHHTDWTARKARHPSTPISASLPKAVLHETVLSLNLLFPHWDRASNELLKQHRQDFHCHPPYEGPRTLNLMEFDIWRDRLLELNDVVFTSPPASIRQLFLDRRSPQQFWTFWIAILILFLTVVSTVASVYQAVRS